MRYMYKWMRRWHTRRRYKWDTRINEWGDTGGGAGDASDNMTPSADFSVFPKHKWKLKYEYRYVWGGT